MNISENVKRAKNASKLDMANWFRHYGSMDYQRTTGSFKKEYRNVTNYNFGAVSAARGDSLNDALTHAGIFNRNLGKLYGNETHYGIRQDAVNNITHGWNDYHKGVFDRKK